MKTSMHDSLATSAETTRARLIDAISVDGPIAAGELAERFNLTGAAVRRHLTQLEADGIIEERQSPPKARGRGRPRKEFVLAASTESSESEVTSLALLALAELKESGGLEALISLAHARASHLEEAFNERVRSEGNESGPVSPARRAAIAVAVLSEHGYAASLRPVTVHTSAHAKDGTPHARALTTVQLCQGRCPIQEIAAEHPEICEAETGALSRMLGTPVQRLATRASGAHVCTTHLTPAAGQAILEADDHARSAVTTDLLTEGRKP